MKFSNTVYAETCVNSKPGHVNFSVVDDRHTSLLCKIVWIFFAKFYHEAAVDFFYDLINTWEKSLEDFNWPLFKSFCKDCVVCICECMCYNIPSCIPTNIIFIHKDAHKFRDSYYRMSIVKLDYMKISKFAEISSVISYIMANQILQ